MKAKKLRSAQPLRKTLREVLHFFLMVSAVLAAWGVFFKTTQTNGISMLNTIQQGGVVTADYLTIRFVPPLRGTIILFSAKPYDRDAKTDTFIKRVIALPGETLEIKRGYVYINGKLLEEPYVSKNLRDMGSSGPVIIPEDRYWVMGDNRKFSTDSRVFGPVRKKHITARAHLRWQ